MVREDPRRALLLDLDVAINQINSRCRTTPPSSA
jgi:predicted 2-oxoglutarate/Fe(II)-dependent dioxygenase YbiX